MSRRPSKRVLKKYASKDCKSCSGSGLKLVCDFNFIIKHIPCDCVRKNVMAGG